MYYLLFVSIVMEVCTHLDIYNCTFIPIQYTRDRINSKLLFWSFYESQAIQWCVYCSGPEEKGSGRARGSNPQAHLGDSGPCYHLIRRVPEAPGGPT